MTRNIYSCVQSHFDNFSNDTAKLNGTRPFFIKHFQRMVLVYKQLSYQKCQHEAKKQSASSRLLDIVSQDTLHQAVLEEVT